MKFEYKTMQIGKLIAKTKNEPTVNTRDQEELENALNELGAEGWELVQITSVTGFLGLGDVGYCIFKRQLA